MNRLTFKQQIGNTATVVWDIIVIGGGATGLGVAMDAAQRGFRTLLLEQSDFAKGTSSRSTKLVHGGVRYLAQGDVGLVKEALHERGLLLANAPHLAHDQEFIIPYYKWWQGPFYGIGLKLYDFLSGRLSLGPSRVVGKQKVIDALPAIRREGLKGGIVYHDGQFDDARLAVNIAQTAAEKGAVLLNYFKVTDLTKTEDGKIHGVAATDLETGETYDLRAKIVINATGVFADDVLQMDKPGARPTIRPSQGVHLVLDASFLNSTSALMIPKTADGRVLFALPWHGKVLVGTTDTPLNNHSLEPQALETEVHFILETAGSYLQKAPTRSDVLSVYAGLRPLAAPQKDTDSTKEISRSHKIITAASGLITITGGKWTTFRKMAEDTVDVAIASSGGGLAAVPCATEHLHIHGYTTAALAPAPLDVYGSDTNEINALIRSTPALAEQLHPRLPYIKAQVVWAVRQEMARTLDDVLSRRLRAILLDARAAIEMAPAVATILAAELGKDKAWEQQQLETFTAIAGNYLLH